MWLYLTGQERENTNICCKTKTVLGCAGKMNEIKPSGAGKHTTMEFILF